MAKGRGGYIKARWSEKLRVSDLDAVASTSVSEGSLGRAAMAAHIEDLPKELLLLILDLLPQSDLIATVPYVCVNWCRLSLDFHLWRNRICDIVWDSDSAAMTFYRKRPALRSVEFQRSVSGAVLRCLASHCPSITTLNLHSEQRLSLRTLRAITRKCDQVRHLHVNGVVLSCRRCAREVALMPRLETLSVHGPCQPQLRELGLGCASLRRLEMALVDARLEDLGVPLLRRLQGLVICWVSVTRVIRHCAESLQSLTLGFHEECFRPESHLAEDLLTLKALTHVDAWMVGAGPQLFHALLQPLLRSLTLSWSTTLDDDLVLDICHHCPLLEDLDLSSCNLITGRGLSSMWRLRRLQRLRLSHCRGLGSGAATHLARCVGLQELNMEGVDLGLMEPGVVLLLELRKMRVLVVQAWTARDLIPWASLPKAFPDLRNLELGEWMSLDTSLLENLKVAMPAAQVNWYISRDIRAGEDSLPVERQRKLIC